MWPHFPLEFAFLFIEDKLAFWHAGLLCRIQVLNKLSAMDDVLVDGEMAAVYDIGGRRNYFNFKRRRFWELAGCTARTSTSNGAGWRPYFDRHPKCTVPQKSGSGGASWII